MAPGCPRAAIGSTGIPDDLRPGDVALLGLPTDEASSFLRGAAQAPAAIRQALGSPASNLATETGVELGEEARWRDLGDLALAGGGETRRRIETAVGEILDRGARVLALGGDHAVTWPLLRAYGPRFPELTLLQIDAHPDLYDDFEGDRFSHACPMARILEQGLVGRLVQVGVRTMNRPQRLQAERFGVEVVEMRRWHPGWTPAAGGPLYLSLDLDGLDPAFAPGVSHPEPGGLISREVIDLVQRLPGPLVGADVVELNPRRDPAGLTAQVAAKLVKEIAARLLEGPRDEPPIQPR